MALLASGVLTAVLAWILRGLYRRAVLRGMERAASASVAEAAPSHGATARRRALSVIHVKNAEPVPGLRPLDASRIAARRYALAGLAYSVAGAAILTSETDSLLLPLRWLFLITACLWPVTLTLVQVCATRRRTSVRLFLLYFGSLAAAAVAASLRYRPVTPTGALTDNPWFGLSYTFLYINLPPSLLGLLILPRPIRTIGPLLFAFVSLTVFGLVFAPALLSVPPILRAVATIATFLHFSGAVVFLLFRLCASALCALAGYATVRWVIHTYREKKISGESLRIDSLWLVYCLSFVVFESSSERWHLIFAPVLAFAIYRCTARWGWRLTRTEARAPMLLVLRVFALGSRSARLFDNLSKLWLRVGSIAFIVGPDLATETIEPRHLLAYIERRLGQFFVRNCAEVNQRVADLDVLPDADGRYRINECFCDSDSWRPMVSALAARCNAAIMDLRAFSTSNHGVQHEIGLLLDLVPLDRVTVVLDDTTDCALLETTIRECWNQLQEDSPNRELATPTIRFFHVAKEPDVSGLFSLLWSASESASCQSPG